MWNKNKPWVEKREKAPSYFNAFLEYAWHGLDTNNQAPHGAWVANLPVIHREGEEAGCVMAGRGRGERK